MKYIILTTIIGSLIFFSSCSGGSKEKKEKAREESIKKAEEEAKQKAEQDKKQAWQDLLNACKNEDEQKKHLVTNPVLNQDVDKQQVRHLINQGKLNEKANKFSTMGKRKTEFGYLISVIEYYNEREEIMGGLPTKIYDSDKWLFSTDEQGNILDVIKTSQYKYTKLNDNQGVESHYENVFVEGKKLILEINKGIEQNMVFTGEKIRYKVENGKFVETSRKKQKYEIIGD